MSDSMQGKTFLVLDQFPLTLDVTTENKKELIIPSWLTAVERGE
ncbi:hypothetical protein [Candidatus Nitrospira neomarina]|uniref:Uncharacterized protein n=1 Tax=Candidatus Nitrospira neomarina TaxID=3020899 RepID=A0AA96JY85_9BACT|nr:hypothetical protein [Candidatus Nitrospira neomarina]WNM63915.1 hypothetical protein PQG83_09200 [Candidatus Nitrospira neomarina]